MNSASKGQYTPQAEELIGQYIDEGWKLLRLHHETKRPVSKQWQDKPGLDREHALAAVRAGQPIGVQVGEVSGWIACVDHDAPETVKLAPHLLPPTLTAGKGGIPSHYVYRSPGLDYSAFDDIGQGRLIDVKASSNGKGHQFVVAPSVHPQKGPYEWTPRGFDTEAIAQVGPDELREAVGQLAASALIARHLPEKGRHDYSLALAGYLLRNGISEPTTTRILRGAWWCKDAPRDGMEAVSRNVSDTAEKLKRGQPVKGGRTLEELVPRMTRTLSDFLRLRNATDEALPSITVNDRPLRDVGDEALRALEARNIPPTLFSRAGKVIRLGRDENDAPIIQEAGEPVIRHHLTRAANFVHTRERKSGVGEAHVHPPRDVVQDVLSVPHLPFPPLIGVPRTPFFRPNGTIVTQGGYDEATRLYYVPAADGEAIEVPARPSGDDLAAAVVLLDEAVGDFPYVDAAAAANTLALLLTPIMRNVISGPVPLALIDKPTPGTGGSLLAEVVSMIATGSPAGMMSAPRDDEEVRKQITSALLRGNLVVTLDNVDAVLNAPSLSRVLTSEFWEDRVLGRSEMVRVPQRATWVASGNNLQVGGDLPRRGYWIRLDAGIERPWERGGFRHPHLKPWVAENRARLVSALLTLGRAWFAEGKPVPSGTPTIGGFEGWSNTIGGVLGVAGVAGFLDNLGEMYERAADGTRDWSEFLESWRETYADAALTTKQIAADLHDEKHNRLRDALPDEFGTIILDRPDKGLTRKLGKAFAKRDGRRHGPEGLHLARAGSKDNATQWAVRPAPEGPNERISLSSFLSFSLPTRGGENRGGIEKNQTNNGGKQTNKTNKLIPKTSTSSSKQEQAAYNTPVSGKSTVGDDNPRSRETKPEATDAPRGAGESFGEGF